MKREAGDLLRQNQHLVLVGPSAPNDRISAHLDGNAPAQPANQHEQQIIEALTGRYDQIEALWNEAEQDLKRFRIPHAVERCYTIDDRGQPCVYYVLAFTRYGKGWRICHGEYDDHHPEERDWKPIIECPLDVRLSMIAEFEHLRKMVIEAAEEAVPTLDEAIPSFRKILKS